jgi:hypothetical protein
MVVLKDRSNHLLEVSVGRAQLGGQHGDLVNINDVNETQHQLQIVRQRSAGPAREVVWAGPSRFC